MSASTLAPEKMKSLFGDLGKATMRGVRKCPKCGTFNGTRGVSCKNKTCDAVFKEKERKRGHSAEAVKIITGSTVQVFSVRLRDRGPDYRGFVQLPLVQDLDGNPATVVDTSVIAGAAKCYVETCVKVCLPEEAVCSHIKSAIECIQEAQPLTLKNSVLNSLQVNTDMKQAIWLLATETTGPLVQRVTKNIMVVKCKPTLKQPMGFLHFSFYEINRNKSDHPEYKFQCSCKAFKFYYKHGVVKDDNLRRCVHFYACICAFASDDKLAEEFAYFINLDNNVTVDITSEPQVLNIYPSSEVSVSTTDPCPLEIMVMEEELLGGSCVVKRKRKDESMVQAGNTLLTLQEAYDSITNKKSSPAKTTKTSHHTPKKPAPTIVDESQVTLGFIQWLSSVTERINQTMHYQFDGNPEPLVFHAPQTFFECLQQRISAGNKKRRLPNFTTGFVRKDALPLGTFTKYTWHITNILHVKQIFDTPDIPLDITRSFIENRDGSYDLYEVPRVEVEQMDDLLKTQSVKNQTPIRPFERKTFLRVGVFSPENKDPTPFIIEWIPDILPKSRIGELRIKFEYGHQRNGQVEQRIQVPFQDIPLQTIQTIHVQEL